jgi:hypothetical protein
MSLEHSPARDKKGAHASSGSSALEPLLTRDELAARWRVKKQFVTRHFAKLGLRPVRVGKRVLFPISQVAEAERLMGGEVVR